MHRYFKDWHTKTADIKKLVTTQDASGVPIESEETVAAGVSIAYWTNTSRETSTNDKFVDQALGSALLPPTTEVDTTMWLEIGGVKHYIVGVDDVAGMGDMLVVDWRRET